MFIRPINSSSGDIIRISPVVNEFGRRLVGRGPMPVVRPRLTPLWPPPHNKILTPPVLVLTCYAYTKICTHTHSQTHTYYWHEAPLSSPHRSIKGSGTYRNGSGTSRAPR